MHTEVKYGVSLDAVLMSPSHTLVNIPCHVLVELDFVLFMSTPLAGATVLLVNPTSSALVVCVCVWLEADCSMSLGEGQVFLFRHKTFL